jgi:hypothetical protein
MKILKSLATLLCVLFVLSCYNLQTLAQTAEDKDKLASLAASGSNVKWEVAAPYSTVTLTVSAPDGRVFRNEFKSGASAEFKTTDDRGEKLPDGQYVYEIRISPVLSAEAKRSLDSGRGKDDEPEAVRATRKAEMPAQPVVQSGSFSIVNGAVVVAGGVEEMKRQIAPGTTERPRLPRAGAAAPKTRQHHLAASPVPDQVIPDDLIVQGSECVGFDCVNNENFGFDTIKLKENNLRIKFEDTSVSPYPTNDWQLTANDSASGGQSKFSIDDITGSKTPFTVEAGATTNSVYIDSTGRIGFRTSTPVLDLHLNDSDTPGQRFEQNNSGGFSAQTWDVAGNEANFFVRDVTSGSRLPFRIRPGAPTSSIDISASGDVGFGTASPTTKVDISLSNNDFLRITETGAATADRVYLGDVSNAGYLDLRTSEGTVRTLLNAGQTSYINSGSGNLGIGTTTPDQKLTVNGDASKTVSGSWLAISDERLKNIKGHFTSGLKAVMRLQPIRYEYKPENALGVKSEGEHVGFGAQSVQKIIPEAVTRSQNGYLLVNNDPILWTMLNAIKEQQKEIEQLRTEVRQLRTLSRKRR